MVSSGFTLQSADFSIGHQEHHVSTTTIESGDQLVIAQRTAILLAATCFTCGIVAAAEPDERMSLIPGEWSLDRVNADGEVITRTKKILQGGKPTEFIETITEKAGNETRQEWQVKFDVEPINQNLLLFTAREQRPIVPEESKEWNKINYRYVFQIDQDFYHETHNLALRQGKVRWRRVTDGIAVIQDSPMELIKPLLGEFQGSFENAGSKAYGAANATSDVICKTELSSTGTLATLSWQMTQGKDSKLFEVLSVISYDPSLGTLVMQYQTSTGVTMKGFLRSYKNGKLLWERSGDTPAGRLFELCLFDVSNDNVFRHVITKRTLDGIPQLKEENEVILLNRVKD